MTNAVEGLASEPLRQIRDFIYDRSGLFFSDANSYVLQSRLTERVKELGLGSLEEYLHRLRRGPERSCELSSLLDAVTTRETCFFRDMPQLESLQSRVLPDLIEPQCEAGPRQLRIWSAGCSSGEEAYTLSIMTQEALGDRIASWDVRILATDLSESALASAHQGFYDEHSLRHIPDEVRECCFIRRDSYHVVRPKVRRPVEFGMLNLADAAQWESLPRMHVVFCRNVLVYFDRDLARRIVAGIHDLLLPGGYLYVGQSESLHGISREFTLVHFPGAIAYRKDCS